jgi:hypothetical protein
MITWADVIKLLVPVFTAFGIIAAKYLYERRKQIAAKSECLWRDIDQTIVNLNRSFETLDRLASAFRSGKIAVVQFNVPSILRDAALSLADLDSKNAYVYSDCVSFSDMVVADFEALSDLRIKAIESPETGSRVVEAIELQVVSLKGNLLMLAEKEVAVLKVIRAGKPKRYDEQVITRAQGEIEVAKNRSPRHS